jgi:hypothetical protein
MGCFVNVLPWNLVWCCWWLGEAVYSGRTQVMPCPAAASGDHMLVCQHWSCGRGGVSWSWLVTAVLCGRYVKNTQTQVPPEVPAIRFSSQQWCSDFPHVFILHWYVCYCILVLTHDCIFFFWKLWYLQSLQFCFCKLLLVQSFCRGDLLLPVFVIFDRACMLFEFYLWQFFNTWV